MFAIVVTKQFEMYFGFVKDTSDSGGVVMSDVTYVGRAYDTDTKKDSLSVAFDKAIWGEPELNFTPENFIPGAAFPCVEAVFACSEKAAETFNFRK